MNRAFNEFVSCSLPRYARLQASDFRLSKIVRKRFYLIRHFCWAQSTVLFHISHNLICRKSLEYHILIQMSDEEESTFQKARFLEISIVVEMTKAQLHGVCLCTMFLFMKIFGKDHPNFQFNEGFSGPNKYCSRHYWVSFKSNSLRNGHKFDPSYSILKHTIPKSEWAIYLDNSERKYSTQAFAVRCDMDNEEEVKEDRNMQDLFIRMKQSTENYLDCIPKKSNIEYAMIAAEKRFRLKYPSHSSYLHEI